MGKFKPGDRVRTTEEALKMGIERTIKHGRIIGPINRSRYSVLWDGAKHEYIIHDYWLELIVETPHKTIDFGKKLRAWRQSHGYSFRQAGKYLGMHNSDIYRYETGKRKNPRKRTLIRVAERMNTCPAEFLDCGCTNHKAPT